MAEELARKRRVRGAHRGAVTKSMDKYYEAIEAKEKPTLSKLKQLKSSLSGKIEILTKLDDELIDLVAEDDLDKEVEEADAIRERIELTIMSIDEVLERVIRYDDTGRGAALEEHTPTITPTTTATSTDTTATPTVMPTTTATSTDATATPVTVKPTVTDTTTTSVTVTPTVTTTSTDTTVPVTTPVATHLGADASLGGSLITPRVKLPKISLKRFNGDLTRWVSFWDSYNSAIHLNPTLSNIDKFNYLSSLLEGTAAESIARLTLTSANYEAVSTLKKRFGNEQQIVNRHMDVLLHLNAVTSQHDTRGLRRLHNLIEAHVRGL